MTGTLSLPIGSENELEVASSVLHDAVFEKQGIQFNPGDKKFTLRLWREVPESKRTTRVLFVIHKTEYLRAACTLSLFNVESAEVQVRDRLQYYSVFRLSYHPEKQILHIETEGTIHIALRIAVLAGTLVDTGETTWNQFGYSMIRILPWV